MPAASIGWVLLASALSLPWLMPVHTLPWPGFHADALMALVIMAALTVVLLKTRGRWTFPVSAVVIVGLSFVPLLQHRVGMIYFSADAFLASAYLLAFGVAVLLGRRMEEYWPGRPAAAVFASFAIAAGISFAIALNQWLQLDQWSNFTLGIYAGNRPVANVAQSNKLATLYVWGLLAFGWAFRSGWVRGGLTVLTALLLLFGIAMTQSRMGALAVASVMVMALLHPRALGTNSQRWVLLGLFAWFAGCVFSWNALNALLELAPPQGLGERLNPGARLLHWQLIMDAILQRPLLGWGWQQVSVAQSTLALQHPVTGEVIMFSHNLVLDLLVWNGLPLGLLLTGGIAAWFVRHWRSADNTTAVLGMMVLTIFLLHSMLEYPHASLTLLLPAGLLAGTMSVPGWPAVKQSAWSGCREGLIAFVALAMALCFFLVVRDYSRIEAAWMAERVRAARIGNLDPIPLPDTPTLGHLNAVLVLGRTEPRKGMSAEEIAAMKQLTYRIPGVGGMLKLAQAQVLNGQKVEAEATLDRLCRIHPQPVCDRARKAWAEMMGTPPH
ncbi:MAG: Wzy polymerase domain-containing protein [Thiobacillus sp.]